MRVAIRDRVRDRPRYGGLVVPSDSPWSLAALLQVMTDSDAAARPSAAPWLPHSPGGRECEGAA
jgi:hypothetical protein